MSCSVPECGKPSLKRGMCNAHYLRWWKYGDPLSGSTRWGEAKSFYENIVLPYEGDDCLKWPFACVNGYGQIRLDGRLHLVSRLACEAEHGPALSSDLEAAHSCGNGHLGCVNRKHLRWATRAENREDMIIHGRSNRGVKNPFAALTEADVRSIRHLLGTAPQREIARRFGVTQSAISAIAVGKTWSWMESI